MSINTIVLVGTLVMLLPMVIVAGFYRISIWKIPVVSFLLTVCGIAGTYIWCYVENGHFNSRSFYGAVFIVPILFIAVAMLLRIPYGRLMDLCAPSECVMLTIMKLQCLADGCCGGRTICLANGAEFVFPSQIVELIDAFAIAVILICMSRKEKHRDKLYPWYMVIYGATRFVLNLFRGGTTPFALGLPAGNVWSLVAIIIGTVWLLAVSRRKTKQENC